MSVKDDIRAYQVMLDLREKEIETLKFKLENIESIQRCQCCECERGAIQDLSDLHFKLMPFEDDWFKGLDTKTIAELAKKSIRIGAENSKLEQKIDNIREYVIQTGIDHTWGMRYQRWKSEILKIIDEEQNENNR